MNILHAFVLGLVQGLGEFLPISSSAHLIIVPWLFKWPDPGLGFDVALHWGTLVAVLFYFRNDVWLLIKGFFHSLMPSKREMSENIYQKLAWLLIIASVPGAIIGKLLEKKIDKIFHEGLSGSAALWVAIILGAFGLILWLADMASKKTKNLDRITWIDALLIGIAQALAVFPGVSRSGATIATGLGLNFKREDAARFSFLMSIPIIFGAGVLELKDFHSGVTTSELVVGFLAAAVFGFLSIKYLLRYISRHSYNLFVWYRIIAAVIILAVFFARR